MGGLSLADALLLCELLAKADPSRYERAALRWLQRFIDERSPPLTEVCSLPQRLPSFGKAAATSASRLSNGCSVAAVSCVGKGRERLPPRGLL